MHLICVDDESLILEDLVSICEKVEYVASVKGFTKPQDAKNYVLDSDNKVDVAILDIDMPIMNGLELAKSIKAINPKIEIIFLSGFSEYAVQAFKIRASGYILKPVSKKDLLEELNIIKEKKCFGIFAKTFGNFDLFVNDKLVVFKWVKTKELLAYLIDRNGSSVTRKELAAVIFEDKEYTRSNQVYLSKIIQNLHETLSDYGIEKMFVRGENSYSVNVKTFSCDAYDFKNGIKSALEDFHGEYMNQYPWAEFSVVWFLENQKTLLENTN